MLKGACRGVDPKIFYPDEHTSAAAAKEICKHCPVRQECLEYAVTYREAHGIWGGRSEKERKKIRRANRLQRDHEIEERMLHRLRTTREEVR